MKEHPRSTPVLEEMSGREEKQTRTTERARLQRTRPKQGRGVRSSETAAPLAPVGLDVHTHHPRSGRGRFSGPVARDGGRGGGAPLGARAASARLPHVHPAWTATRAVDAQPLGPEGEQVPEPSGSRSVFRTWRCSSPRFDGPPARRKPWIPTLRGPAPATACAGTRRWPLSAKPWAEVGILGSGSGPAV